MKKLLFLGAASLAMAACSSGGDADRDGDGNITAEEARATMGDVGQMTAGQYEMSMNFTEVDIPGMPDSVKGMMTERMAKGFTVKHCITEEQAKDPGAEMFGQKEDSGCKMESLNRSGNNMKAKMSCDQPGGIKMTMDMDGDFSSNGYTMQINQQMSGVPGVGEEGMTMKGTITAKRLGDCPS